jgi:hypothetical protein
MMFAANHWLQARPVYASLRIDAQSPGQPEPKRSADRNAHHE